MTRRAEWYEGGYELEQTMGGASSIVYPDEVAMLTEEERDEWRAELRAKEARRRPPGFTAWHSEARLRRIA